MTTSQKKADKKSTPETTEMPKVASNAPALIAFHVAPAPKGQKAVLMPIGAAMAHEDGEGFTLQLHLMPTTGGRIVLRTPPKAKKAA